MGCDIHFVVEIKDHSADPKKWVGVFYSGASIGGKKLYELPIMDYGNRDYNFFGALANVRVIVGPPPKGIPADASDMTQMYVRSWDGDGHSHSYDTLYDFIKKKLMLNANLGHTTKSKLEGKDPILEELKRIASGIKTKQAEEDIRVCYFFDN